MAGPVKTQGVFDFDTCSVTLGLEIYAWYSGRDKASMIDDENALPKGTRNSCCVMVGEVSHSGIIKPSHLLLMNGSFLRLSYRFQSSERNVPISFYSVSDSDCWCRIWLPPNQKKNWSHSWAIHSSDRGSSLEVVETLTPSSREALLCCAVNCISTFGHLRFNQTLQNQGIGKRRLSDITAFSDVGRSHIPNQQSNEHISLVLRGAGPGIFEYNFPTVCVCCTLTNNYP
ncbi:hypothetical protein BJ170DRAFT_406287 [Xylariales sp. AK1849]|nr:hypothetical protein BJ170DRAFT_406287 [Xylariales sp. AK1849]